jgi:hypothetical protein
MVGITIPPFWRRKQGPTISAAKAERRAATHEVEALRRQTRRARALDRPPAQ